ncbi:hypothetical protein HPP92_001181 [Vanilla planifolia]|uniref:Uncharacterized protein n=1 Tax=Vanilla planifolia TaxID=51239 RepID=A0A835RZE2_VANPL|nr:hypothetical protein HPP92_001330 [Vanilla planifolia]KAG0501109.1 hypothetical protein HPP92_001181 [Vanilla planifolia]
MGTAGREEGRGRGEGSRSLATEQNPWAWNHRPTWRDTGQPGNEILGGERSFHLGPRKGNGE